MFRVNVQGNVMMLNSDSLFDLLQDLAAAITGVIIPCAQGYVVDSPSGPSVLVNVSDCTPIPNGEWVVMA